MSSINNPKGSLIMFANIAIFASCSIFTKAGNISYLSEGKQRNLPNRASPNLADEDG